MSDIKLKNAANTEFSISHNGTRGAKSVTSDQIVVAVETIEDFPTNAETGDTVIVKDISRGGTFIYDATQSAVNNGGTIFDGWKRVFSDAVNVKWFGAKGDGITNDTTSIQNAFNTHTDIYIPDSIFLINQISIKNDNTIIKGNGTLKISSSGTALIANGKTNIKIENIKILGSNTPTSAGSQDGDKGIYLINCTNSYVKGVVTSNTYAWGIIQGGCTNCDFIDCTVLDSNNQSCIAITNGSSNSEVINCSGLSSHLYGLEIENNCSYITVDNLLAINTVAGVSIVTNCSNIKVINSNIIDNVNTGNVPPNPAPAINGMGMQIIGSSNIIVANNTISNSKRTQIYILNGTDIKIDGNTIDAHPTQDLRGCIYIDGTISPYSDNILVSNNTFDCKSVEQIIQYTTGVDINLNVIGNEIKNPDALIIRARSGTGIFKDNRITTAYSSNPTTTYFKFLKGTGTSGGVYNLATPEYNHYEVNNSDYLLMAVNITWTPATVTGNPQWFLEVAGVGYLIGASGTGYVAGTIYSHNILINKYFLKNVMRRSRIISTTGDIATKVKFEYFEIPII